MTQMKKEQYIALFGRVEALADEKQAEKMSSYMQNRFPFLGLPKPKLMEAIKPFLRENGRGLPDWDFIDACWQKDWREAQYIALEYLAKFKKKLTADDLPKLQKLITTKSWWETADTLDGFVGVIVLANPALKDTMLEWSRSENLWLRRVAIDFQQRFGEDTDAALLEEIIGNSLGSREFFINKAIGWSLLEYSKTDPSWVAAFLEKYGGRLDKLSRREATKYLS